MKKIVAVVITLAFALTGLAAVSAGAAEPTTQGQTETVSYQPQAYLSDGATLLLTSGPVSGK